MVVFGDILDTSTNDEMMDAKTNRGTCRETDVASSRTSREDDIKMLLLNVLSYLCETKDWKTLF